MENRRKNYRHTFEPLERLCVELQAPAPRTNYTGDLVDLSVGGMRIWLGGAAPPPLLNGRYLAYAQPPGSTLRLGLNAGVVHVQRRANGCYCGLRFLPSADPSLDERREQSIWRFLLGEQRRALKKSRELAG